MVTYLKRALVFLILCSFTVLIPFKINPTLRVIMRAFGPESKNMFTDAQIYLQIAFFGLAILLMFNANRYLPLVTTKLVPFQKTLNRSPELFSFISLMIFASVLFVEMFMVSKSNENKFWSSLSNGGMTNYKSGQVDNLADLIGPWESSHCSNRPVISITGNFCDPYGRVGFNYPSASVNFLNRITSLHDLKIFAFLFILLFASIVYLFTRKNNILTLMSTSFLFSPAIALGFERGNLTIAIVAFEISGILLFMYSLSISSLYFRLAGVITGGLFILYFMPWKYFPIVGIFSFFLLSIILKNQIKIFSGLFVVSCLLLILNISEIFSTFKINTGSHDMFYSFGRELDFGALGSVLGIGSPKSQIFELVISILGIAIVSKTAYSRYGGKLAQDFFCSYHVKTLSKFQSSRENRRQNKALISETCTCFIQPTRQIFFGSDYFLTKCYMQSFLVSTFLFVGLTGVQYDYYLCIAVPPLILAMQDYNTWKAYPPRTRAMAVISLVGLIYTRTWAIHSMFHIIYTLVLVRIYIIDFTLLLARKKLRSQ
jgi:hypothetical protein